MVEANKLSNRGLHSDRGGGDYGVPTGMETMSVVSPWVWGPRIRGPRGDGVNNTRGHCAVRFEICCSLSPSILWCKCFFETVVIKEKAALCVLLQTAVNVGITTDGWSVLCRL